MEIKDFQKAKTIMIEIKSVYLQSDEFTPGEEFAKVNTLISNLYDKFLF